jgi:dihydrofolate synthase/folylpolyglutamate synthase
VRVNVYYLIRDGEETIVKAISNFREAETVLNQYIPRPYASAEVYTLDRIKQLLVFLGNPQEQFKVVHVAGTSGKTSTSYYAAALLQAAGYKVGLTVSPHVDEINERVQINLQPIGEVHFCASLTEFMQLVDASGVTATYYELLVSFAYWEFACQQVEYAVVEVGLGGLLDGTNVIMREDKTCIITDIGLDHVAVLGDTLGQISAQKAGIIHQGNDVFVYRQSEEVMEPIRVQVAATHASLHVLEEVWRLHETVGLPLFQQRNFSLALTAINHCMTRDGAAELTEAQRRAATEVYIPARMEELTTNTGKHLIIDGAHNAQKISTLLASIKQKYPEAHITALVSFVDGTDSRWQQGLDALLPAIQELIVTSFSGAQDTPKHSVSTDKIRMYCDGQGFAAVSTLEDPAEALEKLQDTQADLLLVVGSFYLLNHIRPSLSITKTASLQHLKVPS